MVETLQKQVGLKRLGRLEIQALAEQLPPNDAAVDALLGEAVAAHDDLAFTNLVFAALVAGRLVDSRHLAAGAMLLPDPGSLGAVATRCRGDVAGALIAACASGRLGAEREATALYLAAEWCVANRGGNFSPELIANARITARRAGANPVADMQLLALSDTLKDSGLASLLQERRTVHGQLIARDFKRGFMERANRPVLEGIPEQPLEDLAGHTLRRAAPRLSRNATCSCGSGKKYKRCCFQKDQERLQRSSPVAGLTVEELRQKPEAFLSPERIEAMRSHELARLDPRSIPPDLQRFVLHQLILYEDVDAAVRLLESVGMHAKIADHWKYAVIAVTRRARRDLLERLLALRADRQVAEASLEIGARLLLAVKEAGHDDLALAMIESRARECLGDDKPHHSLIELAHDLLRSAYPALGILISRGAVPIINEFDAWALMDVLGETRDKLYLPPDDPIEPVYELVFQGADASTHDSEELSQARQRIEGNAAELRRLREELGSLRQKLTQSPQPSPQLLVASPAPLEKVTPPGEEPAAHDLRKRIANLETELKERHNERNQFRRELKKARHEMDLLRARREAPEAAEATEAMTADQSEDALLIEAEVSDTQPPRIPVASRRFIDSLQGLPEPVTRAALRLVGRLAAGDAAAFQGAKRLKLQRDVLRQRIGNHRLLFRFDSERIELVDLISRGSLERTIRTLGRS